MPAARHRATTTRRMPLVPALGVAALALATLGAAIPAPVSPTAEQPLVFDGTDGVGLEGRGEAAAGRSEAREEAQAPEVRDAVEQAFEAPLPEVTGQLWATTAVNVRTGPSADDEQVTTLAWAEPVDVTGETEDGWTQIIWDEQVAWVSSDYLAEEEPVAEEPEEPEGQGVSSAACATTPGIEASLQANAAATYRAVCAAFPGVASAYGGYRAGDGGDHGSGHALDIMVSGAAGWDLVAYLQAHAGELGITYLIYEQQIWMAGDAAGAWEYMSDRGSPTANHYDHVHVSTA